MGFPACLGWVKGIFMDQTGEVPGEPLGKAQELWTVPGLIYIREYQCRNWFHQGIFRNSPHQCAI